MPYRTLNIPKDSDTHRELTKLIQSRLAIGLRNRSDKEQKWIDAEESMLAFSPVTDSDAVRNRKRENGEPQYTTIMLPYTYAQVMAAHTYLTSVFFSRNPVHQLAGRNGTGEQQVMAMEAMLQYQVDVGQMLGPYYLWLYDAPKYGMGVLGTYWDKQVKQYSSIEEQPGVNGQMQLVQRTVQVAGYEGNCGYNISPFDFIADPRVTLANFQKGEFACVKKYIPWNEIVVRQALGYYMNVQELKTSGRAAPKTQDGSSQLVRPDQSVEPDTMVRSGGQDHPAGIHAYEFYVTLLQKEWGLGQSKFPEKWVFTITQDYNIIIGASPLGMVHDMYPFDIAEPELDAYAAYTRGIPEIMEGVQNTLDWLVNSHMFNVRQSQNNMFIGDPSKIMMKDVKNANQPGFFFRLRPEAYGTDVRTVLTQLQVTDVTRNNMADMQQMFSIGERVLGISDQMLGMIGGSGRKTATEVRTSTGFGVNRLKTLAEYISAQGFSPHAQKLLQTTQQFYGGDIKLRIVGEAANLAGPQFLGPVSSQDISGQFDFMQVDGTLPIDRMAQANLWKELLMAFRQIPELGMQFDIGKIFAWTAQLSGLKNIDKFRVQLASPEQLAQQAAAGNVVPIRPPGGQAALPAPGMGSPDASTTAGLNAMGGQ